VRYRQGFFLAALAAAFFSQPNHADDKSPSLVPDRFDIEADRITFESDSGKVILVGRLRFGGKNFLGRADNAELHLENSTALIYSARITMQGLSEETIEASRIFLNAAKGTMRLTDFHLRSPAIPALDIHGKRALCYMGECVLWETDSALCPHEIPNSGFRLKAEKLVIYPSGTMDMEGIVFLINDMPLTRLPWIRLRPQGKPGFLMPRIGYNGDAGLILGQGGLIPITVDSFLEGSVAVRSRQGFETESFLYTEAFDLKINQLFITPKNLMRYRMNSSISRANLSMASRIDWLQSDRRIVDESTVKSLERAFTHTSSNVVLSRRTTLTIQEAAIHVIQSVSDENQWARPSPLSPTISLTFTLPTIPFGGHFFIAADAGFIHRGAGVDEEPIAQGRAPSHSRLQFEGALSHIRKVGPFSLSLDLKMRDQQWVADDNRYDSPNQLLVGGALSVSMPLFRDYQTLRHILSPLIRYRITPLIWGRSPNYVADSYDLLRTGHGVEIGVTTSIARLGFELFRLDIFERIALNGFQMNNGPSYLALRGALGPSTFQATLDGAWDQRMNRLSVIGLSVHRTSPRASVDVGFRRLAPGQGPHLDQPFSLAFLPWTASSLFDDSDETLEVFQFGEVPINDYVSLTAGARGEVYPNLQLHALWYGLKLHTRCKCLSASIMGSHRVSNPVPDIFMTFEFNGM
jgi:hypothetical protein